MSLYQALYEGFNGALAALQLFNLSPQPANLADIVQNDRIKNPAVVLVQKSSQTNLESFLKVKYTVTRKEPDAYRHIGKDTIKPEAEILHHHIRGGFILKDGKIEQYIEPHLFVESVLVYATAISQGKKLHLVSDMSSDGDIRYMVFLLEGSNTAVVYDPKKEFREQDFKHKIKTHFEKKRQRQGKESI